MSVCWQTNGTAVARLGRTREPFVDAGWRGGTIAFSRVPFPPPPGSSSAPGSSVPPSSPPPDSALLRIRIVFGPGRVSLFLPGTDGPVLSVPYGGFSPDAFPAGAKLAFFGRGVRFHGFSFRQPRGGADAAAIPGAAVPFSAADGGAAE